MKLKKKVSKRKNSWENSK